MGGLALEVTVTSHARLHFGIVDMRGDLQRIHCSAGVAIEKPLLRLTARKSDAVTAVGPRANRVVEYAKSIIRHFGLNSGFDFRIDDDIPEHMGFGSGTQLALSVGTAISQLENLEIRIEEIASLLMRSRLSGVGARTFIEGGFIIDGGHKVGRLNEVPPVIFHSDVPENWYFVVGVPCIGDRIFGETEKEAFRLFEPPPKELICELARIVLLKMMPSIVEGDIVDFGSAITSMDATFGDYWAKIQGGRYGHPYIEAGVRWLLDNGAYGVGQSSWGPAYYGLTHGETQAKTLADELSKFMKVSQRGGETFYARPCNKGAEIEVLV